MPYPCSDRAVEPCRRPPARAPRWAGAPPLPTPVRRADRSNDETRRVVGERRQQRRRHECLLHPVGLHRPQHDLEVEAREGDDGAAAGERVVEHAGERPMLWKNGARPSTRSPISTLGNGTGHLNEVRHERGVRQLDHLRASRSCRSTAARARPRGGSGRDSGGTAPRGCQLGERRLPDDDHVVDAGRRCCLAGHGGERPDGDQDASRLRTPQLGGKLTGRQQRAGSGDTAPPARRPPCRTFGNSGMFGRCSASTSPAPRTRGRRARRPRAPRRRRARRT